MHKTLGQETKEQAASEVIYQTSGRAGNGPHLLKRIQTFRRADFQWLMFN